MQNNSTGLGATIGDPSPRHALPPQIFNDDLYCGVSIKRYLIVMTIQEPSLLSTTVK